MKKFAKKTEEIANKKTNNERTQDKLKEVEETEEKSFAKKKEQKSKKDTKKAIEHAEDK